MSVALTEQAVRDRIKNVTRRKGWWEDKNGRRLIQPAHRLILVRKAMGLKKGEKIIRICEVEAVSVRREPLELVREPGEVEREGFPGMDPDEFMARYFLPQGISPTDDVTRIEYKYTDWHENDHRPHQWPIGSSPGWRAGHGCPTIWCKGAGTQRVEA